FHTNDGSYPLANGTILRSLISVSEWNQRRGSFSCPASVPTASAFSLYDSHLARDTSSSDFYLKVLKAARDKFTKEVFLQSKDKDISLAKALLYIAAEDQAFMALSPLISNEKSDVSSDDPLESDLDLMPLAGKKLSEWLSELDVISREVEAELVSKDIGCHIIEVLEAINLVLFERRRFKRLRVAVDPEFSYLPGVLSSGRGSAILLSLIYIEVCQRLGLNIVGSRVGEDFIIWPQTETPQELFKTNSGRSFFAILNGGCVEDPRCMASELNSSSLSTLDIATNRDIIGIALANLIRLHWKRASRMDHGLMLASALRPVCKQPVIRTQDLSLAIMAAERLLILQPHNWVLRREHGLMLYYNREYGKSVEELSICMAFAPEEEAAVLEPFVVRLHLMRLESTWKSVAMQTK
ncbi:hypothetical protein V2J09_024097, partial [Rumex salicifolius]